MYWYVSRNVRRSRLTEGCGTLTVKCPMSTAYAPSEHRPCALTHYPRWRISGQQSLSTAEMSHREYSSRPTKHHHKRSTECRPDIATTSGLPGIFGQLLAYYYTGERLRDAFSEFARIVMNSTITAKYSLSALLRALIFLSCSLLYSIINSSMLIFF